MSFYHKLKYSNPTVYLSNQMEYIYPKLTSFEQQNLKMEISKTNIHLYIKTRHIRICVPHSRPNGWTEWAGFFLWTLMGSLGVTKAKSVSKI